MTANDRGRPGRRPHSVDDDTSRVPAPADIGAQAATFGDPRLPVRFWAKATVTPAGCWEWTGCRVHDGYGRFSVAGRMQYAHRVAWAALEGDLPDWTPGGLTLDHLCRRRACVNPAHLELVTNRENLLRGDTITARLAARDVCERGHRLTLPDGARNLAGEHCRDCRREDDAANAAAQAAAIRAAHTALGLTQRAYVARFGYSRRVAVDIAARVAAGVRPEVILAGADAALAAADQDLGELAGQLDLLDLEVSA